MHAINWFEIPVNDIERAATFYSTILDSPLDQMELHDGYPIAMLPAGEGGVCGALIQGKGYTPSREGALVYLNGGEDLSPILNRVEAAGGKVLMSKTSLGPNGFAAAFLDSEGNKVGLHSPQ